MPDYIGHKNQENFFFEIIRINERKKIDKLLSKKY